jgi:hypothetical protein
MVGLAMLGTSSACVGKPFQACSAKLPDELAEAWQKKDPSAADLVRKVLEDSLNKTYCYDLTARDNAFDLVHDLKLTGVVPLLRGIAAMDYKVKRDYQQTWDLESIRRSLDVLTQLRDPMAVELNEKRITSDAWLQAVAIKNLGTLGSWDSTDRVVRVLGDIPLDDEHRNVVMAAVGFLERSPRTTFSACPRIKAVSAAFADCFDESSAAWKCGGLVSSMAALNERLRCEPVAP